MRLAGGPAATITSAGGATFDIGTFASLAENQIGANLAMNFSQDQLRAALNYFNSYGGASANALQNIQNGIGSVTSTLYTAPASVDTTGQVAQYTPDLVPVAVPATSSSVTLPLPTVSLNMPTISGLPTIPGMPAWATPALIVLALLFLVRR